ncbi:Uncharacterized protein APZ42_004510 [Daphnia magna]|uniref:Uncharacterized protein n=1 Tax=Daphnia magna TaxID=35525 RepID=A0A164H0G4_9CRUS|nr:Uncharacterized protein APZ42_004510 [Daphnia magna]
MPRRLVTQSVLLGRQLSDVTISTTLSQKRSTRSTPTDRPRQTSQLDLHIQKQMLELEVKLEQSKSQKEANAMSVTQTLSKALKGMGEQLGKLIDSSHVTSTEITANTQLVEDSRKTLQDMDQKIETVKTLLDADTSSREQSSRPLPIMHPACGPSIRDNASSDTSSEHQPANGSTNHPHGGCCSRPRTPNFTIQPFDGNLKNYARFKAKFRALYDNEYDGSPALLFMLEELLSKEVWNEIGECLADGTMYSVVWDHLDAVYGRTEVMDQTYLDGLLQIPPLKSQDAASLKTFANRLHGAGVTLSQSRTSQPYYPDGHRSKADNMPAGEVEREEKKSRCRIEHSRPRRLGNSKIHE